MADSAASERKARLEEKLQQLGVTPFWMHSRGERVEEPGILRWSALYPLMLEAGEVITLDDAFRRAFSGDQVLGGYQIVMPGETAAAHRHTASAVRLVVQGDGRAYTTTNGEQQFMEFGDFLVQPGLSWHDHGNLGQEPVIFDNFLDIAALQPLEVMYHEDWPDGAVQPVTHAEGSYAQLYGNLRPPRLVGAQLASPQDSPPVTYKFRDALQMLERMAAEEESDPYDGIVLEYTNPVTGGHTLPTMSARIEMLLPGEATRAHRHSGFERYTVLRGKGVTTVDLENPTELDWEERDLFKVPSWRWHRHHNQSKTEPAILFSISYSPLARALGFYREEKG